LLLHDAIVSNSGASTKPGVVQLYIERQKARCEIIGLFHVHDPSWDVGEDALYAARLSTLRGSESGFAMMRVAGEGC
jgi:hypothetical protein